MFLAFASSRLAFLVLFTALLAGCAERDMTPADEAPLEPETPTKSGLDGPSVPVGPFLDGALPSRTPYSASTASWSIVNAFPGINLPTTITLAANPGDDRIYAGSQDGVIVSFANDPSASTVDTFLDLRDRVAVVFEGGLLAMAFHPESGQPSSPHRNSMYVYYTSHCPLDASRDAPDLSACDDSYPRDPQEGFFGVYLRLSRFEVGETTRVADPGSEQVLVNFRMLGSLHRGGGLDLKDNGELFLAIGDQGDPSSAQDISDNLNGGVLRIDVNVTEGPDGSWSCGPNSHLPRRIFGGSDEVSGRHYCIPDDNPWLDPGGSALEEYCAIGLRNPFRLSVDPPTGRVWVGDVGSSLREEVNVIECGNNYGWPFREGIWSGPGPEPSTIIGVLTEPLVDFDHSLASSIIGGVVYRGSRLPELYGVYIAGDFGRDLIWSVALDETTMSATSTELTSFPPGNLVSFVRDNDGEVYFTDIYSSGSIYQLERASDPQPDAPALLSQTGAFSSMSDAEPSSFWVPYQLNQPFWSDGAQKFRYIALPNDGVRDNSSEQVSFSVSGDWSLPTGTVLMKHFELPLDETDPTVRTRLETRFMVLGEDDVWYGLTYRWRADQLEADLLTTEASADYTIAEAGGTQRQQTWYFPARRECLSCHRDGAGGALGLKTHQLNGDFEYPTTGRSDNQLVTWDALGMLSPSPGSPDSLPRAPSYRNVSAPLQDRVRSWLDSNCGYCHRPDEVNAGFDLRYTTPFEQQNLLWTPVREDLGNPGTVVVYPGNPSLSAIWQRSAAVGAIAMPPLAKALAEEPAVALLAAWIERLPSSSPNLPPVLSSPGDQASSPGQQVALTLSATDADFDDLYFDADGLPEGLEVDHDSGTIFGAAVEQGVQTVTVSVSDGPEVAITSFEWTVTSSGAFCGNGTVDPGEECDDGNVVSGDGCAADCQTEVLAVCGDGVLSPTEACEPPGTDTCADDCTIRTALCGDGFLTAPEQCEDGNLVDGDGCSSTCTVEGELTSLGEIIAAVPNAHFGTWDIEEIRDGTDTFYDTWDKIDPATEDWIGYQYTSEYVFDRVVFWEGPHFLDGGWFDSLTVQVRQGGVWNEVEGLVISPAYPGNNGIDGETFDMTFTPILGDAIRIYGDPGGSANFISVTELQVFSSGAPPACGNGTLDPGEECDDGNSVSGDGCSAACQEEMVFCGDGIVDGAEECEPPDTATCADDCTVRAPLCGDRFLTPPEECDDGNLIDGDGCSATCVLVVCGDRVLAPPEECDPPTPGTCAGDCTIITPSCGDGFLTPPELCEDGNSTDGDGCSSDCTPESEELTSLGAIIAAVPNAHFGQWDIEDIRDGTDSFYDTWDKIDPATEDWIGYEFPTDYAFTKVVFWEGPHFFDGGWFDSLTVQVRQGGVWNEVEGLVISPAYPGNNGIDGETFDMTFTPILGDAIRIYGDPGGSANFISVTELRVFGLLNSRTCGNATLDPGEECDDGNNLNGDGCTSDCLEEAPAVCGDGFVTSPERCEPPGVGSCSEDCEVKCSAATHVSPGNMATPFLLLLLFAFRGRMRNASRG